MLKKLGFALGALVWFAVVFTAVFYLTFPSDLAAERARWEVQTRSGGGYGLNLSGVRPAWVGLAGLDPVLTEVPRVGDPRTVLSLDKVKVKTGLIDAVKLALGGTGGVHAVMSRGGGDVDATVQISRDGAAVAVEGVEVSGAVPLSAIPPMGGVSLVGDGELEVDSSLVWDEGFGKADGNLKIEGRDLVLEGLRSEDGFIEQMLTGFEGLPAVVSRLVLDLEIVAGKATVRKGRIDSDLVNVDIEGDVTLSDDIGRSRVRLSLVVELGPSLESWAGADLVKQSQKTALWGDGKYHYSLVGILSRLSAPRPDRERRTPSARPPSSSARGVDRPTASSRRTPTAPKARTAPTRDRDADPPTDARARGRLAQERARARQDELDDEEMFDDEDELLDEELDMEDLPELEDELDGLVPPDDFGDDEIDPDAFDEFE